MVKNYKVEIFRVKYIITCNIKKNLSKFFLHLVMSQTFYSHNFNNGIKILTPDMLGI